MKNAEQIDDEIRKELCNEYGIKNDRLINCQIHPNDLLKATMALKCGPTIRYKDCGKYKHYQLISL